MSIIRVQDLSKVYRIVEKDPGIAGSFKALFRPRYKDILAVDRISFVIEPGELVGYIGVNGAGKSTTIKMLTGILLPSGGAVRVLDRDPYQQRVANARDIGVVFGQRSQLWWDLPLIESLNFIQRIYEIPPESFKRRLDEFAETLELKALFGTPIRNLSLGQKMRAELAATLIHDPLVVGIPIEHAHRAAAGHQDTGEHLDGGGLARAVDADVADHLTRFDQEANPIDSENVFVARPKERLERAGDAGIFFDDAIDFAEFLNLNEGHGLHRQYRILVKRSRLYVK